ncbi:MAG: Rpn family recombination-promoting nuclease/putative transposase, partial [Dysgonamonadaceae bacterium]|nr:Rpn family recombination-promoting nuclease/putative transposase [Dysgonamonadaceae bacterium]
DYISHISLMKEETKEKVSNILNFIIIELPKFRKEIEELNTNLDRWLFSFKNLYKLEAQPSEMQGDTFNKLFSAADTNKLNDMEQIAYQKSLSEYSDVRLMMDYSRKEGRMEGIYQTANKLLKLGLPIETISQATGLTVAQIRQLH